MAEHDRAKALFVEWLTLRDKLPKVAEQWVIHAKHDKELAPESAIRFQELQRQIDLKWAEYKQELANIDREERRKEIEATTALARTNTTLAKRQFFLGVVIALATVVQAVAAAISACKGGH